MIDIEFIKENFGWNNAPTIGGYLSATEDMLPVLEEMLTKSESFEELKKELTSFCQDRKSFIDYTNYGFEQLRKFKVK